MTQSPHQPEPQGALDQTVQMPAPDGPPGRKSRAGMITALVVAAVLVGGGIAVAIYLANRDDPAGNAAPNPAGTSSSGRPEPTASTGPSTGVSVTLPSGVTPSGATPTGPAEPPAQGAQVDPAVQETAQRYAKAVSDRDEATAKSLSCNNQEAGILFENDTKVEVIGKTQMLDATSATIDVKVTIGQAEPLEGFPLLLTKEPRGWCVS
ncbi:hypothetical protein [Actinophytocola sp.]|uniref:hypothetical protein n=1 Tax=Actinophytocola sp. TaxID=1872138 RepID=UPI002D7E2BA4|nr:hypothetical protein [Actinophytocola sp.]HET9140499.1 hypothetical protein [Actinophytocola sp.]